MNKILIKFDSFEQIDTFEKVIDYISYLIKSEYKIAYNSSLKTIGNFHEIKKNLEFNLYIDNNLPFDEKKKLLIENCVKYNEDNYNYKLKYKIYCMKFWAGAIWGVFNFKDNNIIYKYLEYFNHYYIIESDIPSDLDCDWKSIDEDKTGFTTDVTNDYNDRYWYENMHPEVYVGPKNIFVKLTSTFYNNLINYDVIFNCSTSFLIDFKKNKDLAKLLNVKSL